MTGSRAARVWIDAHHDAGWDVLRVYLGLALFVKGVGLLRDMPQTRSLLLAADFPFPALAEPVAVAHLMGGLLLAFGLWTRLAGAVQVPLLAGAVLFVHGREGLFSGTQALPLAVLMLVLASLFAVGGAGGMSLDALFASAHAAIPSVPEPRRT
jgi:putative oxidoreductase